jgi:hypothetical protein
MSQTNLPTAPVKSHHRQAPSMKRPDTRHLLLQVELDQLPTAP